MPDPRRVCDPHHSSPQPDPQPTEWDHGVELVSSWMPVRFISLSHKGNSVMSLLFSRCFPDFLFVFGFQLFGFWFPPGLVVVVYLFVDLFVKRLAWTNSLMSVSLTASNQLVYLLYLFFFLFLFLSLATTWPTRHHSLPTELWVVWRSQSRC